MPLNGLTSSLTHFILIPLLILIPISAWSDHSGFAAILSATDVVDDGNPNSIEVESREASISFTAQHDVDIQVVVRFDKPIKKSELTSADFETYLFNQYDEIVDAPLPLTNLIPEQLLRSLNLSIDQLDSKNYILRIMAAGIPIEVPDDRFIGVVGIILRLKKGAVKSAALADTEALLNHEITSLPTNEEALIKLNFVRKEPVEPVDRIPKVVSITKVESSIFRPLGIQGRFEVKIVLTEQPKVFTPAYIDITNARIDWMYLDAPFGEDLRNPPQVEKPPIQEGNYADPAEIPDPSGRDGKYYPYFLTITPDLRNRDDIVIKVNAFEDRVKPPNRYIPPRLPVEGRERLTLKIHPAATITPLPKPPGFRVALPHEGNASLPANGFYILAKDYANSGLASPPALPHYNVRENSDLLDLEYFLTNGGTIDLVGPVDVPAGSVVISEVLWGQDWNLADGSESQWVELYNTTGTRLPISENSWFLHFYKLGEPVPSPFTPGIIDRIGTLDRSRTPWPIFDKGQSGGVKIQPLISMERLVYTTKRAADGTKASSWIASPRASHNVELTTSGRGIATPGFINLTPLPEQVISLPEDTTIPIAARRDIAISEIMYAVSRARLPQWIELHNRSGREVNLQGWEVTIENDPEDEDVLETSFSFTLGETFVGADQAVLLVTERGRHSGTGNDLGDFREARVINLKQLLDIDMRRYRLLSDTAFKITLTPPSGSNPADTAGNLGTTPAWELPVAEGEARSSIIRSYALKSNGTMADEWLLASEQTFKYAQHDTYYGRSSDQGTPGYRAGNALPVQLSSFRPVREKSTGAVVITWTTESELNNAGFNILRGECRYGDFVIINPTLILGAGTSRQRHTYHFTDTTAKSDVVYYYRIEEVSLSGDRQQLTTVRLRGHLSGVGKLLQTWGNVKYPPLK